ncbi:methylhydantoinase [Chromatiales bacterium (ex Bugula neritina AB1)]|nr:methylhydantoinase [Chromatiales bacterium (ex Bugula neritina AB1)]
MNTASEQRCRLAVDIGGTFTDVVLESVAGRNSAKVLTTHKAPEEGVMQGIDQVLLQAGNCAADVQLVMHGTTLATNALIERKGAKTAFLTTAGFRDILEMGFEKRFAQYNLDARRPAPLVPRTLRYTVPERISASGNVVEPLDQAAVRRAAGAMREAGVEAVAVGFLHAYAHPQHEREAAEILSVELPDTTVCLSSEVCPEMREYERFSTTAANSYIRPLMAGYLGQLRQRLIVAGFSCPTFLMMSGGGLTTLDNAMRLPIRLVESGPAGGALLAADIARSRNLNAVLAFDMGGTTAKICLIENGKPDRSRSFEIAREYRDMKGSGLPVRIPVIEMIEIGAGGGSIARIDEMQRIRVGPDSAGSDPGPVAYGSGGKLPTVTDANLSLGKIDPDNFAGGHILLDKAAAAAAIKAGIGDSLNLDSFWSAAGIVEIVEENMANAAQVHAIERGREPSEYTMVAFGGGAPLHAARLAEKLGISNIIVPVGAGVGSAIGFLRAPVSYQVVRSFRTTLSNTSLIALNKLLNTMTTQALNVVKQGAGDSELYYERLVELRYLGQGHELSIELPESELVAADLPVIRHKFEALYEKIYGLAMPDAQVECVSWSITVSTAPQASDPTTPLAATNPVECRQQRKVYDAGTGGPINHGIYQRSELTVSDSLEGPAVVVEEETSTVVPTGFSMVVDTGGALSIKKLTGKGNHS